MIFFEVAVGRLTCYQRTINKKAYYITKSLLATHANVVAYCAVIIMKLVINLVTQTSKT